MCILDYTKLSMEYLEWDGFVSFLECWTASFKSDPSLKEDEVVVRINSYLCIET